MTSMSALRCWRMMARARNERTCMRLAMHFVAACAAILMAGPALLGSTYYVDFDAGKDANDGSTTGTAWKHAPGDPAATDAPGGAKLAPGDILQFKGGVIYRGNLLCKWSGEKGKPIVYDG